MDGEETEVKMDEKGDVLEVIASELGQLQSMSMPCGQDKVCDLPHKSSTELTRTPTIPFVTSMVDEKASIPLTSSALEVEGVLGVKPRSSPAPIVTATPTLSFPVRKHIEDRPNRIRKASLTAPQPNTRQGLGPGLMSCSTSAIVCAVKHASTVVQANTLVMQMDEVPVSPQIFSLGHLFIMT